MSMYQIIAAGLNIGNMAVLNMEATDCLRSSSSFRTKADASIQLASARNFLGQPINICACKRRTTAAEAAAAAVLHFQHQKHATIDCRRSVE